MGKKIAETVVKGTAEGAVIGGGHGMVSSIIDKENPLPRTVKEGAAGAAIGLGALVIGGKIVQNIDGKKLKGYGDIDKLSKEGRNNYRKEVRGYYNNYIKETNLNKNGEIKLSKRGVNEVLRWNPKQGQNFPELKKDIKNAEKIAEVPNIHEDKPNKDIFEIYKGKNGYHLIEVSKDKTRKYYFTRDTLDGTHSATSTGSAKGANNIIPNQKPILNYPKVLENENVQRKIYNGITKTGMLSSFKSIEKDNSKKEYKSKGLKGGISVNYDGISVDGRKYKNWSKKEQETFWQGFNSNSFTNSKSDKTDYEVSNKKDKTGKMDLGNTDNGHWVTLKNGNHVFIED